MLVALASLSRADGDALVESGLVDLALGSSEANPAINLC
jgi:hypothetical protein